MPLPKTMATTANQQRQIALRLRTNLTLFAHPGVSPPCGEFGFPYFSSHLTRSEMTLKTSSLLQKYFYAAFLFRLLAHLAIFCFSDFSDIPSS